MIAPLKSIENGENINKKYEIFLGTGIFYKKEILDLKKKTKTFYIFET